jgi:hypothetical protein
MRLPNYSTGVKASKRRGSSGPTPVGTVPFSRHSGGRSCQFPAPGRRPRGDPVPGSEPNGQMAGLSKGFLLLVLSCVLNLLEDMVQIGPFEEPAIGDHCGNLAGVVNIVERVCTQ